MNNYTIDVMIVIRLESYYESCSSFFPFHFHRSTIFLSSFLPVWANFGINQIFHASHFPTPRIHEVARGNRSTCLRVDRRLSRFCARLTAVCAELRLRSPRLTVPGRIGVSLESSLLLLSLSLIDPREKLSTPIINKLTRYRLARRVRRSSGGRLDYRAPIRKMQIDAP